MNELLPCPLCGVADIRESTDYYGDSIVWCEDCMISTTPEKWNRRTPPPATAEALEIWRSQMDRDVSKDSVPDIIKRILAEWPEPTDPAPGTPPPPA